MYTEASSQKPGYIALLQSDPLITSSDNVCLNFWYHMYGKHMGTLLVYYKQTGQDKQILWNQTGQIRYIILTLEQETQTGTQYLLFFLIMISDLAHASHII